MLDLDQSNSFYDDTTSSVDEGWAVHIAYLDFSKAFNTVSHNILIDHILPSE